MPALFVLLAGWLVVLLRDPLPLDETRYAEVLRELLAGSKLALTLNSEGYSHKTPMLFWFAWLAHSLGLSLGAALLVWPAIFSSLTVLLIGRIGERLGLAHADWLLAGMVLPLVFSGIVLFDAMLTASVWLFLWAQLERRPLAAGLASIPMMMAKGPAALVFAIPYGLCFAPHGKRAARALGNLLLRILPGLIVLGGWAYIAILKQGSTDAEGGNFAANLAWNQTAGRVVKSFAHARPVYWYLPIILIAAMPYSGQLLTPLRRLRSTGPATLRRLTIASLVIFVIWSLISGKQPHYLLPMLPALALLFAADLGQRPKLLARVRALGVLLLLALGIAVLSIRFDWFADPLADYGERAELPRSSATWNLTLGVGLVATGVACILLLTRRPSLPLVPALFALGMTGVLAPIHAGLGTLLLPRTMLEAPIRSALEDRPLATIGNQQAGLYNLYFEVDHIDRLSPGSLEEITTWCRAHPGGALFAEEKNMHLLEDLALTPLVRDRVRGKLNWVLLCTPGAELDLGFLESWPTE